MNIDDLTLGQIKQLQTLFGQQKGVEGQKQSKLVGKHVIVRTESSGVWFGEVSEHDNREVPETTIYCFEYADPMVFALGCGPDHQKTSQENARRIVACVNALAGYTTEEIEQMSIKRIEEENRRLESILGNGWHLEQQAIQSIRDATDELSFDERNELVLSVGWIAGEDDEPAEYGLRMSLYEYPEEGAEMLVTMTPPKKEGE
jgi:hypothetical protein